MQITSKNIDKESFKQIFDNYFNSVRNFVYYKLGDAELADDIVQDVFIKCWEVRDKVKIETVKSLLYKIAENLCKNHFKHQKVRYNFVAKFEDKSKPETPDFIMEKEEFDRKIQSVLAQMPEKCRLVFLMSRMEDLTYSEIAERLNLSVKAIEKRMHEALDFLKKYIKYKI